MALQLNAMEPEKDPFEDLFITEATIALNLIKEYYAQMAEDTGYFEGKLIADMIRKGSRHGTV